MLARLDDEFEAVEDADEKLFFLFKEYDELMSWAFRRGGQFASSDCCLAMLMEEEVFFWLVASLDEDELDD